MWMMALVIVSVVAGMYAGFNLFVTHRINTAYYVEEERRRLHKKFIWLVPFVGPLIILGFWRKRKKFKFDTITKPDRDKKKGAFYESGMALILLK